VATLAFDARDGLAEDADEIGRAGRLDAAQPIARLLRRLRARRTEAAGKSAAAVIAREHREPIPPAPLRDELRGESRRARITLSDHRLARVDDEHVVAVAPLGRTRKPRTQRERDISARICRELALQIEDLAVLLAAVLGRRRCRLAPV